MRLLVPAVLFGVFTGGANAALKPVSGAVHPTANKAAMIYKSTPQGDLNINLYFPSNWTAGDLRPAIILFFGGSCATGTPAQFASTAEYFASRGLVAAAPEYRIATIHHTTPERCIEDGKSAMRWIRMNARHLGIDARRVIAGGGSSGASIAAFAAYNQTFEAGDEDRSVPAAPAALVLLNPAFGCPPGESSADPPCNVMSSWKVSKGGPPAVLFYGTEDPLQDGGRDFARQLIRADTRAEFYTAAGQPHGFFNRFPDSPWHALVLRQIDLFLSSLGYLNGDPAIAVPAKTSAALRKEEL